MLSREKSNDEIMEAKKQHTRAVKKPPEKVKRNRPKTPRDGRNQRLYKHFKNCCYIDFIGSTQRTSVGFSFLLLYTNHLAIRIKQPQVFYRTLVLSLQTKPKSCDMSKNIPSPPRYQHGNWGLKVTSCKKDAKFSGVRHLTIFCFIQLHYFAIPCRTFNYVKFTDDNHKVDDAFCTAVMEYQKFWTSHQRNWYLILEGDFLVKFYGCKRGANSHNCSLSLLYSWLSPCVFAIVSDNFGIFNIILLISGFTTIC